MEAHGPASQGISLVPVVAYTGYCETYVYLDKYIFFSELLHGNCYGSKFCCVLGVPCAQPSPAPSPSHLRENTLSGSRWDAWKLVFNFQ